MRTLAFIATTALVASCNDADVRIQGAWQCAPSWRPIFTHLDRAVLAVGGSAADDVYLVGGGLGSPGRSALIAHFDGFFWRELVTNRPETLWWVHAVGRDDVWMVGDEGLAMHWNGKRFLVVPTGTNATLFGAWGTRSDDVWLVGGKPGKGQNRDNEMLLHWDGAQITRESSLPRKGVSYFKVFDGEGEMWISGESGTLFHHTGAGWRDRSSEVQVLTSPFSLGGCSSRELYAVGGKSVYSYDGLSWQLEDVAVPTLAIGVSCSARSLLVVGTGGMKLRYDKSSERWIDDQFEEPYEADFHGGWIAPDGAQWVVGGNLFAPVTAERIGVVGYRGCEEIPSAITIVDRVPMRTADSDEEEVPLDPPDAGALDAGEPDVEPDAAAPDAQVPEAEEPDAEEPDAGAFDAGEMPPDAGCSGAPRAPVAGDLVINEILADPAATFPEGDANGDGVRSATEDEFVEIVNASSSPISLAGVALSDSVGIRHLFAPATLECGGAIVVFGGGDPFHPAWRASWTISSEAGLGLNNAGDTVSLGIIGSDDLATAGFGPEAEIDQSLVRSMDLDGAAPMIPHASAPASGGRSFSPGDRTDGTPF